MEKQIKFSSMILLAFLLLVMVGVWACKKETQEPDIADTTPLNPTQWQTFDAFPTLSFRSPVDMTHAGDGTNRIFVVEQAGRIQVFPNSTNATQSTFLDITSRVLSGGELGLLGLAFHPDYRNNGQFFINYTRRNTSGQTESVISRFRASSNNPNQADANSEQILLTFPQPFANHNGGAIFFGKDGFLYIASGDGGSGGDPQNNSQNLGNLLGKILRIDVNRTEGNLQYAIPPDNPFVSTPNARREIYAYGLRNPWKTSLDKQTGRIWSADVGQNAREEVNLIERGGNYGWRFREGKICYNPAANCPSQDLVEPIWDYSHAEGRSVTGGYVYRGRKFTELRGKYIYGDYISGKVWVLTYDEANKTVKNENLLQVLGAISSFGQDEEGEVYVCNYQSGKILGIRKTQ